jgi:hypothetical protein
MRMSDQLEFGRQLRDVGMGAVVENESYKQNVADVIGQLAASGFRFTAEDIREIAGSPTGHPNVLGALMHLAIKRGVIKRVDYMKATRVRSRARVIAVYVGTQEPLEFK